MQNGVDKVQAITARVDAIDSESARNNAYRVDADTIRPDYKSLLAKVGSWKG